MSCNSYEVFNFNTLMAHPSDVNGSTVDVHSIAHEYDEHSYYHSFEMILIITMHWTSHILIVGVTLPMVYRCFLMGFEKTALHAHLCTIGFVLLMAEGLMVRNPLNPIFKPFSRESKTLLHALLQLSGGFCGIIGTLHKYWGKEVHFKSRHGKFGLAGCILCFINMVSGLTVIIVPSLAFVMKLVHSSFGVVTFTVCMFAQITGYDTGFFRRNFYNKQLWKFATFAILLLSVSGALKIINNNIHSLY